MTNESVAGRAAIDLPSPNRDDRPADAAPVDTLVLHYTGMVSAEAALERLTAPEAKVSAHWCIGEDGTLWRLVPEEQRAWHAGLSEWRGRRSVNDVSIGIELVNPGHEHGYRPFPPAQMDVLLDLARAIVARHAIDPRNVVAHSDIAPERRQDPGELFDWARLAEAGIGLWPESVPRLWGRAVHCARAIVALPSGGDRSGCARSATGWQPTPTSALPRRPSCAPFSGISVRRALMGSSMPARTPCSTRSAHSPAGRS